MLKQLLTYAYTVYQLIHTLPFLQMSNGATSDISSSDETSHGEARATVSPHSDTHHPHHPDISQDSPIDHIAPKPDLATPTTTTTTFDDHIVIKEMVPQASVGMGYKNLTMATPKVMVGGLVKPIPTKSPPKALVATNNSHITKSPSISMASVSTAVATTAPQSTASHKGSPPAVSHGGLNATSSSTTPATSAAHRTERPLLTDASQKDKVHENGKFRSESDETSS